MKFIRPFRCMTAQKILRLSFIIIIPFALLSCGETDTAINQEPEKIEFIVPSNFPAPVYNISRNPITTDGFILGRTLFYDGILSRDGTISCGSCHQQSAAFAHVAHDLSHGIDDKLTLRNTPALHNLAWQKEFFWDGGVGDLDLFAINPIQAHNEMDETLPNVLNKLRQSAKYPPLFKKAFGSDSITLERFLKALSQFQLMCISSNSKFDKYQRGEASLTAEEMQGKTLFDNKCTSCHKGTFFTDLSYRNNGLTIRNKADSGRAMITLNPAHAYQFKVPSLRNITETAPYMHDGRFSSLEKVLDHYDKGVKDSPTLDPLLRQGTILGIPLTAEEKRLIIVFLATLKDDTFLRNRLLSEQ